MIEIPADKRNTLASLFTGFQWNYIPDAILEGHLGRAYTDDPDDPKVAALVFPKVKLHILGGDPTHPSAKKYLQDLPALSGLLFASEDWETAVQQYQPRKWILLDRFAFTSENLDLDQLRSLKSPIPEGYRIEKINLNLAQQLTTKENKFAADHIVCFDSPEHFLERGFGCCILQGEQIVAVASTFTICDKGIEIQIDTRNEHRRKGLASLAAAHLIVHSLENGLDPNWDAATEISRGLCPETGLHSSGNLSHVSIHRNQVLGDPARYCSMDQKSLEKVTVLKLLLNNAESNFIKRATMRIKRLSSLSTSCSLIILSMLIGCASTRTQVQVLGSSMEPSLLDGQVVEIENVPATELQRGDFVYYDIGGGVFYIKRLIGLPGETVEIREGLVYINGIELDEPYRVIPPLSTISPLTLGIDEYYVLGDDSNHSYDSQTIGPIPGSAVIGRVVP